MAAKKVSIRDVSRASGVSVGTVSRIINKSGRYSKETEARVYQVMQELDYIPNKIAQSMRTNRNPLIGILVPDILNESYALMIRTIQTHLMSKGFMTAIFNTGDDPAVTASCIDLLRAQQAAGMICIPDRLEGDGFNPHMPVVFLTRRPGSADGDDSVLIEADNCEGGRIAAEFLLSKGCRTFGVLMDEEDLSTHTERLSGFMKTLKDAHISSDTVSLFRTNSQRTSSALSLLQPVAQSGQLPDGIFSMESRMTIAAMKINQQYQTAIALIGYGRLRLNDYDLIHVDTISEPVEDMADQAADALVQLVLEKPSKTCYRFPVTLK